MWTAIATMAMFIIGLVVLLGYTDWAARKDRKWKIEYDEERDARQANHNQEVLDRLNGFLTRFEQAVRPK